MRATSIDALLLVDKPAGISSHDVVALVRRALGTRKVGHGGTLDPFATGLLVLMTGRGTRLLQFVPAEPKIYDATIRFGTATDSDDATGAPIEHAELPDPAAVLAAIPALTGSLQQVPPAYSAKHVDGERAYAMRAARRTPPVLIRGRGARSTLSDEHGPRSGRRLPRPACARARIQCGTGTYIRALARDLGRAVGSVAHLEQLRRVRVGPFDVADADDIESLRAGIVRRHPLVASLGAMPRDQLAPDDVRRVRQGMAVPASVAGPRAVLLDVDGEVVAIAARRGDEWKPDVVLATA